MKAWRLEDLPLLDAEELDRQSDEIVEKIKPLLAGKHPGVQGVVVANLLAIWLAGHHPDAGGQLLANHMKAVGELIPVYRRLFGTEHGLEGVH